MDLRMSISKTGVLKTEENECFKKIRGDDLNSIDLRNGILLARARQNNTACFRIHLGCSGSV